MEIKRVNLYGQYYSCMCVLEALRASEELYEVNAVICEKESRQTEEYYIVNEKVLESFGTIIMNAQYIVLCNYGAGDAQNPITAFETISRTAIYEQIPKSLRSMLLRKEEIFYGYQIQYLKPYIEVGDFTYGIPQIEAWDDKTKLKIGKFCSIARGVNIILGGNHRTDWTTTYPFNAFFEEYKYITGHPSTKGNITIGNDVWLADGCKILSGVTIGDGAVIAADAVVTKDVPPYAICAGNPAKVVKYRFDEETIRHMEEMKWWNWKNEIIYEIIPMLQNEQKKTYEFYLTHKDEIKSKNY